MEILLCFIIAGRVVSRVLPVESLRKSQITSREQQVNLAFAPSSLACILTVVRRAASTGTIAYYRAPDPGTILMHTHDAALHGVSHHQRLDDHIARLAEGVCTEKEGGGETATRSQNHKITRS